MPRALSVIETGDTMRFRVVSESYRNWEYTVDLLENEGIGTCTCPYFQRTLWPAIRDGKLTYEKTFPEHPDKHLRAARLHIMKQLFASMARQHGHVIER